MFQEMFKQLAVMEGGIHTLNLIDLISKITKLLDRIERKHNIKILFAIENGSRAWGMESRDSDYDIRFVYVRKRESYLTVSSPKDVIEEAFDKKGHIHPTEGAYFDFVGFDILKFARLLAVSNPSVIEWITSPIVYKGKRNKVFFDFATKKFDRRALYYHYRSMCEQNYLKYLKSKAEVTYKKYLYAYRGLVHARWVAKKKTLPPNNFRIALEKIDRESVPKSIKDSLSNILQVKTKGLEKERIPTSIQLDYWLEDFLKDASAAPEKRAYPNMDKINKEVAKTILTGRW